MKTIQQFLSQDLGGMMAQTGVISKEHYLEMLATNAAKEIAAQSAFDIDDQIPVLSEMIIKNLLPILQLVN